MITLSILMTMSTMTLRWSSWALCWKHHQHNCPTSSLVIPLLFVACSFFALVFFFIRNILNKMFLWKISPSNYHGKNNYSDMGSVCSLDQPKEEGQRNEKKNQTLRFSPSWWWACSCQIRASTVGLDVGSVGSARPLAASSLPAQRREDKPARLKERGQGILPFLLPPPPSAAAIEGRRTQSVKRPNLRHRTTHRVHLPSSLQYLKTIFKKTIFKNQY